jgi:hypothetical protein
MQVIFCVWCILPPSAWFSPSNPLPFLAITCAVLLLSAGAAWLHSRFWALALSSLTGTTAAVAAGTARKAGQAHEVNAYCRNGKA